MLTLASALYIISHSFFCIQKHRTILVGLMQHLKDGQNEPKTKSCGLKCNQDEPCYGRTNFPLVKCLLWQVHNTESATVSYASKKRRMRLVRSYRTQKVGHKEQKSKSNRPKVRHFTVSRSFHLSKTNSCKCTIQNQPQFLMYPKAQDHTCVSYRAPYDNQNEQKSKSIGLKCAMSRSLELSTCQMLALASVQYRISHSFLCIQKRRTILVGLIEHPKMIRTSKKGRPLA